MNLVGQTMLETEINNNKTVINTSVYQGGVYFLRIKTVNGLEIQKIMIK